MREFAHRMKTMSKTALVVRDLFNRKSYPLPIAPAREALPVDVVRKIAQDVLTLDKRGPESIEYRGPQSLADLEKTVADHLLAPNSVTADPKDIMIVSVGLDNINLLCQVYIDPGDASWWNPYFRAAK